MGHLGKLLNGKKYYKIFVNKDGDRIGVVTGKKLIKLYIHGIGATRYIEAKDYYNYIDNWYYTTKLTLPQEVLPLFESGEKESSRVIILLAFIAKLNFLRNGIITNK